MSPAPTIRDFVEADADEVNRLAVDAYAPFAPHYSDWPAMAASLAKMSTLSATAEIIVADAGGRIIGAVAYVPAVAPKPAFFDAEWPTIRMLAVDPAARGSGVGRALTQDCLARARRDRAKLIALHTSPIMTVALSMYLRMGFTRLRDAPSFLGVEYAVYTKAL